MVSEHVFRAGLTRAIVAGGLALVLLASCDDPTNPPPGSNDPENISRVTITLTPTAGGGAQTSVRVDPDGSQLPQPVGAAQGTLALTKGATYNGTIAMLNDIDPSNVVDITAEVSAEEDAHQFVYTFELTGGGACTGISVPTASMDTDSNGQPVGLTFQVAVTAGAASTTSCNMRVILHHYDGVAKTSQTFDTDIDITFPVTIS